MDPRWSRVIYQTLPSFFSPLPYSKGLGTKLGRDCNATLSFEPRCAYFTPHMYVMITKLTAGDELALFPHTLNYL